MRQSIIVPPWMIPQIIAGEKTQAILPMDSSNKRFHVGEILWVRELWAESVPGCSSQNGYSYKADHVTGNDGPWKIKWRSPKEMPYRAARIFLKIVRISKLKLHDISEREILSEGLRKISKDGLTYKYGVADLDGYPGQCDYGWPWVNWQVSPQLAFEKFWTEQYGFTWDKNPQVIKMDFRHNIGDRP